MADRPFASGDKLMVTTAHGNEVPAVADSTPHARGWCPTCQVRHTFRIVWVLVERHDRTAVERVPWPIESVRFADEAVSDHG